MVQKYVKKDPVVIEAVQYNGINLDEIKNFVGNQLIVKTDDQMCFPFIEKLDSDLTIKLYVKNNSNLAEIQIYDYVIKTSSNIFYPCKKDIFESTYVKQEIVI